MAKIGSKGSDLVQKAVFFLVVGGWQRGGVEEVMGDAHRAAARDLLDLLLDTGRIERAVVATDDPAWGDSLAGLPVEVDLDRPGEPFHFGRRLAGLIERHSAHRLLYSGGASAPLLTADDWNAVLMRLGEADRVVVTNNLHSCDWVGFGPGPEMLPLSSSWIRSSSLRIDRPCQNSSAIRRANIDGFGIVAS